MEWIILSGSILVAGYFIYSAIQRGNNLKEKQERRRWEISKFGREITDEEWEKAEEGAEKWNQTVAKLMKNSKHYGKDH